MDKAITNRDDCSAEPEFVFERYADMVYRLGFVRTKNKSDADDILQEVFMRYMKVWQNMESEEHIKAMLIRITVNCSNSLLSSGWFKKTESLKDNIPSNEELPCGDTLSAVMRLPVKYRTAIHLHYYMGYSVEEIAALTSAKPSTVKTRLSRARQTLKILLGTEDL